MVVDEMVVENWHERELMESGAFADQPERSNVLVYVVDLSGPAPWSELRMLREELGKYKVGMSKLVKKAQVIHSKR
jgi:GTPase involved in cell partitioning and DNA repair